ncbi:MAG: SAM-dependent methyltransferase [Candidatus Zixiibacteriota bacterium]
MTANAEALASSFRDPSGFVFTRDGSVYRQVNRAYEDNYDHLMRSGLYESLVGSGLLIPHDEVETESAGAEGAYKILKPELIPFISYPYEWCFSQLKDAASTTLQVQKTAVDFGMTLKDSSAYNVQFLNGRPVFIDTLSFERYREGQTWAAYRQFCQHFLAPLALMSYRDVRLSQLSRVYLDGIPLDLAGSLLPFRSRLRFSLLSHIHLHAKSQKYFADKSPAANRRRMSLKGFLGLIDSLQSAVERLKWRPQGTEWADYYEKVGYSQEALEHKRELVRGFLESMNPSMVWDLGANTGLFSRIAGERGITTISFDVDPAAVEKNYLECREQGQCNILPLVLDLTNPSPSIGWRNRERDSFVERGPADTVLALALIHHLAISNNLPVKEIADFFGKICDRLIIEFVPKSDSQVQRLLSTREDIFADYTQQAFERSFREHFRIQSCANIRDTKRTLYLMEKR